MKWDRFRKSSEKGEIERQVPRSDALGKDDATQAIVSPVPQDPSRIEVAEDQVPAECKAGDVILDLYEVKQIHEGGGMGLVYRVHHRGWNIDLAMKSPRANYFTTEEQKQDFARECETWINLGLHPQIVSCHYVRTLGGIPRVFAEYVEGGSLRDWIDSKKLYEGGPERALERILDIAIQTAWGIQYAHEQGVIHQDIKPGNIMLTPDGTAKITDFGTARARYHEREAILDHGQRRTLVTFVGRTPAYCSPEQARREKLTRATDIWSWAVTVLEMFAGGVTWAAGQVADQALEQYMASEDEASLCVPIPGSLGDLLRSCLIEVPEQRQRDAASIAGQLVTVFRDCMRVAYYRTIPTAAHSDADDLNNRAASLIDIGQTVKARSLFSAAIKAAPQHIQSTYNLAMMQWRACEIDDSEVLSRLARITGGSKDVGGVEALSNAYVHLERFDADSALETMDQLQREFGSMPELPSRIGFVNRLATGEQKLGFLLLSPEANRAVVSSAGWDPNIYVYDLRTNTRIYQTVCVADSPTESHGFESIDGMGISRNGRFLATTGNRIRIWDMNSFKLLTSIRIHSVITAVAVSSSGSLLLYEKGYCVKLHDVVRQETLREYVPHPEPANMIFRTNAVDFSMDSNRWLSASADGRIKIWDSASECCQQVLVGHTKGVLTAHFDSQDRYVVSGSFDGTARIWDLASGCCVRTLNGHGGIVTSVHINSDATLAVSSATDQTVKVWDVSSGRCLRTLQVGAGLKQQEPEASFIGLSSDGKKFVSKSSDGHLCIGQIDISKPVRSPYMLCRPPESKAILARDRRLEDSRQRVLSWLTHKQYREAYGELMAAWKNIGYAADSAFSDVYRDLHRHAYASSIVTYQASALSACESKRAVVAFLADHRRAISFSRGNERVSIIDLEQGRHEVELELSGTHVLSEVVSSTGESVFFGTVKGTICALDIKTRDLRYFCFEKMNDELAFPSAPIVALNKNEPRSLLIATSQTEATFWSTDTLCRTNKVYSLGKNWACVAAIPSTASALCGGWMGTELVHADSKESEHFMRREGSGHCAVAISHDGKLAIVGCETGELLLIDISTREITGKIQSMQGPVTGLVISSDDRILLATSASGQLCLYEIMGGRCLLGINTQDPIMSSDMTPDAVELITGHESGRVTLWRLIWDLQFNG